MAVVTALPAEPPAPTMPEMTPSDRREMKGTTPKVAPQAACRLSGTRKALGLLKQPQRFGFLNINLCHCTTMFATAGETSDVADIRRHRSKTCAAAKGRAHALGELTWQQKEKRSSMTTEPERPFIFPRAMQNTPPRDWMIHRCQMRPLMPCFWAA
jgi:hypothetical protein